MSRVSKVKIVFYGHCGNGANSRSIYTTLAQAEKAAEEYSVQAGYRCC
jgi:hypothetical protein